MSKFKQSNAYKTLEELAQNPVDLTKENALSSKRIEEFVTESHGIRMLYGTERINDKVMKALFELAEERQVFDQMYAMQNGEVINSIEGFESENRKVLHTAMRDIFDQRIESAPAKEATQLAYDELEKLKTFLSEIDRQEFTDLIQIGIGGSELGPKAIYLSLEAFRKKGRNVHFISNVDPDDAAKIVANVDLDKTLVVVVSKSGSTLETLTNEELIRTKYKEQGLSPENHFIAVTGKGSPMDDTSRYRASFYIYDFIGGRYSVTSMVGGVALAFALGMEKFLEFLRGASCMDKVALSAPAEQNLPLLGALIGIWNRNFLNHPTCAIIPYSQAMIRFTAHLQQNDMESNGKCIDKQGAPVDFETGPIIWGEPGTNGQHSFYQLIHQGTTVVPVEFIGFKDSQYDDDKEVQGTTSQEKLLSNLFAQSIGLATGKSDTNPNKNFPGNRPNHILLAKQCDPFTIGALLSYFENKVAFQGFLWNINSFDQEGVQLGKVLANQIIDMFAKKRVGEEVDQKGFPAGATYLKQLDDL